MFQIDSKLFSILVNYDPSTSIRPLTILNVAKNPFVGTFYDSSASNRELQPSLLPFSVVDTLVFADCRAEASLDLDLGSVKPFAKFNPILKYFRRVERNLT